jgi:preprotein translocase subunit YajC
MFIANAYAESDTITIADTENTPEAPKSLEQGLTSFVPIILILVVFYFFLIRPQEKRRRIQEETVSSVKKGEDVLTSSGFFGKVTSINDSDNTIHIEIAKGVEVKALKSSIADITSRVKKEGKKTESKNKKAISGKK